MQYIRLAIYEYVLIHLGVGFSWRQNEVGHLHLTFSKQVMVVTVFDILSSTIDNKETILKYFLKILK